MVNFIASCLQNPSINKRATFVKDFNWSVGFSHQLELPPEKKVSSCVPGAVQLDWARAEGWESYTYHSICLTKKELQHHEADVERACKFGYGLGIYSCLL